MATSSASVDCIMEELQMTIVRMKCASSKSAEIIKAVGTKNSVIIKAHIKTGEGKVMTWMHLRWNQVGDWQQFYGSYRRVGWLRFTISLSRRVSACLYDENLRDYDNRLEIAFPQNFSAD